MSKYIERIKVNDYVAFGKKIKEWCEKPGSRPSTIKDVEDQLGSIIEFPESRFKDKEKSPVTFIQAPLEDEWVVRLPPAEMVNESLDRITSGAGYPVEHLPTYYFDYLNSGKAYDEDFLYSRIADYTIAQCA